MLAEHGQMARGYADVRANTVASFALGDYEWMLAFEADELHRIVDLMRAPARLVGPPARARGGAVLHRRPDRGRRPAAATPLTPALRRLRCEELRRRASKPGDDGLRRCVGCSHVGPSRWPCSGAGVSRLGRGRPRTSTSGTRYWSTGSSVRLIELMQ